MTALEGTDMNLTILLFCSSLMLGQLVAFTVFTIGAWLLRLLLPALVVALVIEIAIAAQHLPRLLGFVC